MFALPIDNYTCFKCEAPVEKYAVLCLNCCTHAPDAADHDECVDCLTTE